MPIHFLPIFLLIFLQILGPIRLLSTPGFAAEPEVPKVVEKAPLFVGEGEQRVLTFPGLARYSAGGEAIRLHPLDARQSDRILLKGIRAGSADFWVWKRDGQAEHRTVQVEKLSDSKPIDPAILRALSRLEEAEIIYSGAGTLLRGRIDTLAEASRISGLARGFPKDIQDETEFTPRLLDEGQDRLESWLRSTGNPHALSVTRVDHALWVQGAITDASMRQNVEQHLRAVFPAVQLELESLPDNAPTVHFRVFLLELKRNLGHSFGLSWPAAQEGAFRITTAGITESLGLDAALQAMEASGSLRVLSNPELVVRAPGDAELFAGGELPIHTHTTYTSQLDWKSYGLTLKLHVTHAAGDRVRLDITTEVSHLDNEIAMDKVPGVQANRLKTQVDARYGLPLFLSGLLQEGTRRQVRGLPGLSEIPILGALFGSEDYQNDRSELVAILLPGRTPPPAPMDRVGQARRLTPRGYAPAPRNWLSPEQQLSLKESPEYPWNVLR